ncbi:hypothetical protein MAR_003723 [Mya arenaria]|uniref:Uncharacterized protein n=1 Tax=Mya arenaria TaxID=6604 RepID=A0ABY7G6W8_MYAAR|nr:hypothetical protein MAR_003723 [Mya arenaria]
MEKKTEINESVSDITAINIHLDEITGEITKLREIEMKKEDIEHLISATVTAIMKTLEDELKSTTQKYQKQIDDLRDRAQCNETRSTEAIKMSNYNEQYSRGTGETEMRLVEKVDEILKREGAEISRDEILAIHRIPTRGVGIRPIKIESGNREWKN